ncbi:MAG TPA: insulinase family protein, partial [Chitinophagaceae bacterium]|nr:insulinase family protein [Chitinophagaceae bacterium]
KTLLQLIYLKMTVLKKDTAAFNKYMATAMHQPRRHSEAKDAFGDTLTAIMRNHNPRAIGSDDSATLAKVDYDTILRLYKERFGNAADFTVFITGNIAEDSVRPLVETWLGSLPTTHTTETIRDYGYYPPKGIIKKHFTAAMKTPQSTVTIGYTGTLPHTIQTQVLMRCLSGVLQIAYTDRMREKEGGTYGASVSGQIDKYPTSRFILQVNFDSDPAKKDKLVSIAYDEINQIIKNGPSADYLNKVKENLLKSYHEQSAEKNATYWSTQSWLLYVYSYDSRLDYEKLVSETTPAAIRDFAKQLVGQGNLIEVVMDPADGLTHK